MAAAALLAGCGGSEDSSANGGAPSSEPAKDTYEVKGKTYTVEVNTTPNPSSLSKAQLVDRINKICQQGWVAIQDKFAKYVSSQSPKLSRQTRFAQAVQGTLLASIHFNIFDPMRLFGAPQGEEQQVEEMIGAMQLGVERGEKLPIHSVDQVLALFEDFNQRARQYGLDACLVEKSHLGKLAV